MIGAGLVGLTALDLSYISNLADGALVHLQGLSHLKTLSISGAQLKKTLLAALWR